MKSIKLKMMLLCSLLSTIIILLILVATNTLLDVVYQYNLEKGMQVKLAQIEKILTQDTLLLNKNKLNGEILDELTSLLTQGNCLDISHIDIVSDDFQYPALVFLEGLGNCELHNQKSFTSSAPKDSEAAALFRLYTVEHGYIDKLSPKGGQWLYGKVLDNGYIIILSTGITHMGQASAVIQTLVLWIAVVMIPASIIASYFFASWFTRPIRRLSTAAKEIAKGRYEIQLPVNSKDEIGDLTHDFNIMAYEVNKADQLQRDLISSISHDLRTPLTLVKGYAETIRDLSGDNKPKRDSQLNIIINETDRLSALVNSVLQLGKISSGVQKPKLECFDILDLADQLLNRYGDNAKKQGYSIELVLPNTNMNNELLVMADASLIERVFHNLISNAISHIGSDNKVIVQLTDMGDNVLVEVIDHGNGIAKDEIPKIFDRYYRARQNNGKVGTGLGLSIVKAILQSHNFNFGVNSIVSQGASFWFYVKKYK